MRRLWCWLFHDHWTIHWHDRNHRTTACVDGCKFRFEESD